MKTETLLQRGRAALVVAVAMVCCASAWAVPATIQYQGYLADAAGTPVTGVLRVVFRLYDSADPGLAPVALWEEIHDDVPITAGKFATPLGTVNSFAAAGVSFDEPLFLELEVSSEKLLPRLALQSVPYALKAAGVVAGGITAPMLADGAVQPGKVHVSLAGNGLAVSAAGTLQVATGGITAELLGDGSVADRHVSATAAISPAKIAGTAVTLAATQTLTNKTFDADLNRLLNVDLTAFRAGVVLAELTTPVKADPGADDHLATAAAIVQFVEAGLAGQDSLGELNDTALSGVSAAQILVADGTGQWVNRLISGDVAMNALGSVTIQSDAVSLGADTTGLYVATLDAGPGLSGGGAAEGLAATLSVNVDGATLQISGDALKVGVIGGANVAADAIATAHLQDDAVTNGKLANDSLTLTPGTALTGGGSVALGGSVTLGVAAGGIGAEQLAANTDVSGKGFRAAWAADADTVDAAGLDDSATAAGNVLWSSQRIKEYVDGLVLGLDWQNSVAGVVSAVPTAPVAGLRVIASGVAGWTTGSIYEYDGAGWVETVPNEGFALWVEDQDRNLVFNGTWLPLSSTQAHNTLAGLQGGDVEADEFFHLPGALHGALTGLAGNRLLAADGGGLPGATVLSDWLSGTPNQVSVTANGSGGAVLALPQDLATSSSPDFVGLDLGSGGLTLGGAQITAIGTDVSLAGDRSAAVPTEHAVKAYVDGAVAGKDALAELSDVALSGLASGDLLQFNGTDWVNIAKVPGENIELKPDGAITHGSGLQVNLAADGTLVIVDNALGVGVVGAGHIGTDAVALGGMTTGDYVAGITAGDGLSGDASGEGSTPTLAVNVDGTTVVLGGDVLSVGTIGGTHLQDGSVGNVKLANDSLTLTPGTALTGGGSVALGGSVTLGVAAGGIGADQLAADTDVSGKGFRAAWAADADTVDAAGLDDSATAAGNVLWSSQRVKEYVDALIYGLDWQPSVKFITLIVPAAPFAGLRVISDAVPGWADNSIYQYDGAVWHETVPNEGFAAWIEDQDRNFVFNGAEWVPLSSTQDHAGLAGLQGGDTATKQFYHLKQPLYDALTALPAKRLLETSAGLPVAASLDTWVTSAIDALTVAPRGDGGVVLDLSRNVPQATPTDGNILIGNGSDWLSVPQTDITKLGTITAGTWQGTPIDGAYIDIAPYGGLTHGSGLKLNLDAADPALRVDAGNVLRVGELDSSHIKDESLTGIDIMDGSLSGDDLAPNSLGIDRLLGISDSGRPGQTVLADGAGGFQLGSELPLYLNQSGSGWNTVRIVPTGLGSAPWGVVQSPSGLLYVADATGHCIRVFSSGGAYLGWYGESSGDGGYIGYHLGSDPDTPQAGAAAGAFDTPRAVAVMSVPVSGGYGKGATAAGEFLWVADSGNDRIQRLDLAAPSGNAMEFAGGAFDEYGLANPSGIAVLDQDLYIADTGHHRVIAASYYSSYFMAYGWYGSADGDPGAYHTMGTGVGIPTSGVWDLQFDTPMQLAVEFPAWSSYAVLAVADLVNGRAALVNLSTRSMWGWIGADDQGGSGWHDAASVGPVPVPGDGDGAFRAPYGVAFGPYGLAVSDADANRLQFYTYSPGAFLGAFGVTGVEPGQFILPTGLGSASDGALWVCDTGNGRLQKVQAPHSAAYTVVPWESGSVIIGGDIPEASAALQIDSGNGGLLVPRYDDFSQLANRIPDPAEGLLAFCYGTQTGGGYKSSWASDQGFYFWNGSVWEQLGKPLLDPYAGLQYNYAEELQVRLDYYGGLDFNGYGELAVKLAAGGGLYYDSSSWPGGLRVDWDANPHLAVVAKAGAPGLSGAIEVKDSAGMQTALAAVAGASAAAPAVIHLAPGIYTTPLALSSHVDVEGSGIGKTILRVPGGTAVTAAAVVNAGLRQLTIEVVGAGGDANLVGLQYDGDGEDASLRLLHVDIRILGAAAGRAVGIRCGQAGQAAATGLRLEHVSIEVTAAATRGVAALEVNGSADVLDCDLRAGNSVGAAVAVLIDPRGLETASLRQVTASVKAEAAESAACRVRGAGAVQLKGCVLSVAGSAADTVLEVSGEKADRQVRVRIDETDLRLDALSAGAGAAKTRVGNHGRLDAFSAQMLGAGAATQVSGTGRLAASYCLLEGRSSAAATARYTYCTTVDPRTGDAVPMTQARSTPR